MRAAAEEEGDVSRPGNSQPSCAVDGIDPQASEVRAMEPHHHRAPDRGASRCRPRLPGRRPAMRPVRIAGLAVAAWVGWRLFGPDPSPRFTGPQVRPVRIPGRSVFVGDEEFFVREVGPEDAPPIVLIHGWSFDGEMTYFRLVEKLARRTPADHPRPAQPREVGLGQGTLRRVRARRRGCRHPVRPRHPGRHRDGLLARWDGGPGDGAPSSGPGRSAGAGRHRRSPGPGAPTGGQSLLLAGRRRSATSASSRPPG